MPPTPQPFTEPSDFAPKGGRKTLAPIVHLPVAAVPSASDPTQEIRTLIEQLQLAARDARAVAHTLQEEKDELGEQLENALRQIDQLRLNEREIRSQFIEIASVIRERDTASQEVERLRRACTDSQRQSEAAVRERNDIQRQRDDLNRRQGEEARLKQQALEQLTEAQKQTVCLRQARDTANSHSLELSAKISRFEDDFAELGFQRDAAQKTQKQLQDEVLELRRQIGMVTMDRDATDAQVRDLTVQLDEARLKSLENAEKQAALGESGGEQASALAEAREHLASVTVERDTARTRTQELTAELDVLRLQVSELREQANLPNVPMQAHEDLLRQLAAMTAEREMLAARERQLAEDVAANELNLAQISAQFASAQYDSEQARNALAAGQRQFEQDLYARDLKNSEESEHAVELEARLEALRSQNSSLEENLAAANRRVVELSQAQHETRQLATRFEKQRLATIDLGTRFKDLAGFWLWPSARSWNFPPASPRPGWPRVLPTAAPQRKWLPR